MKLFNFQSYQRKKKKKKDENDPNANGERNKEPLPNKKSSEKDLIDEFNIKNKIFLKSVNISLSEINNQKSDENWTILEKNRNYQSFGNIAYNTVRLGLNRINHPKFITPDFPVFQIGNLVSVDRSEIESYQSVKNVIKAYIDSNQVNTPISIAVFGPPGSGKSFGIKEILENLQKNKIKVLTFNLSQFTENRHLISAFHKIRDYTLIGQFPLVFFDEFDCNFEGNFGWIKYFISPMQDGCFFDGENLHPIGKCIFVFAGGVCHEYNSFLKEHDNDKGKKIGDFTSRLRGHINICSCNPSNNKWNKKESIL